MIEHVYRFANGLVMVFDEDGEQIPEYQGRWTEKREEILRDAQAWTEFYGADFREKVCWPLDPREEYPGDKERSSHYEFENLCRHQGSVVLRSGVAICDDCGEQI
jgi:hypothetical protein